MSSCFALTGRAAITRVPRAKFSLNHVYQSDTRNWAGETTASILPGHFFGLFVIPASFMLANGAACITLQGHCKGWGQDPVCLACKCSWGGSPVQLRHRQVSASA